MLVVGLGVSGRAVCELLMERGSVVMGTDLRPREAFNGALDKLERGGCRLRLGGHHVEDFREVDQIIVSPGVPLDLEPLVEARSRGIEIIGELDWAWLQVGTPVVAVSGTNGKTTTTSLIGEIMKAWGKRVFVGGNIGTPLSRWVLQGGEADVLVLEVSSFQLDTATHFRPEVGVLLNVTEDHLDRYESFSQYADSKFSLFSRQGPQDTGILNLDDSICRRRSGEVPGRLLFYSRHDVTANGRLKGVNIELEVPWLGSFTVDLSGSKLQGAHNEENILAACLASAVMGAGPSAMAGVIQSFAGLPHRVEWVRTWQGIDFYNDSKGTNVGAVVKALESFQRPVHILLGGRDKLGSYVPLGRALRNKGKGAYVFGEAADRMRKELETHLPTRAFPDLGKAFEAVVAEAQKGDVVLLSPACSSFDQYGSYTERGDHFRELVRGLPESGEEM
ncbi:MAG: UDP-N-acetylmuramoyl-L-alanine--D-glutamate ligase [Deltaproteobacteria bacterium]|nr:UDP-N-acetylmuramoyl-L-alanine--D-glutamate ligase [Deltaproteobacteria bacterium]